MFTSSKLWDGRKHHLDKMTLRNLVAAFFAYSSIRIYLFLATASTTFAVLWAEEALPPILAACTTVAIYGGVWYALHRLILHGPFLYRLPWTAAVWKRAHYDHHQDPNDLGVLFGSLYTTLPTILGVTVPLGWLIGGAAGSAAAVAMGLYTTCFYEFCHCLEHLAYTPKWTYFRRIKKLHLAHHYHNEKGNFGITNFLWDRILGTYYASPKRIPRSPTVFNLGYTSAELERYPWVAELNGDDIGIPSGNDSDRP